jgi:beta-lactamase class A
MEKSYRDIALKLLVLLFVFSLGFLVSNEYNFYKTKRIIESIRPLRQNDFDRKFIFPLLKYSFNDALPYIENNQLENQLTTYIQSQQQSGRAKSVSVYYRNLLTNQWAGVNQNVKYHPGSIMKVIVMIGCYRASEIDPAFMQKKLEYTQDISQKTNTLVLAAPSSLVVGDYYSVKDLIRKMIIESDNGAFNLLVSHLDYKILTNIMVDLNIDTPDKEQDYTISPVAYSNFLRILYNSTYLNEEDSEEALSLMHEAHFDEGILAGLPKGVVVAQKYGESVNANTNSPNVNSLELNDCGIVYAKNNPYVLCVMTKKQGSTEQDKKTLASIISDISEITYSAVALGDK